MTKKEIENKSHIPDHEIEALAQCFLPFIRDYFDSEAGQKEFEEWVNTQQSREE